MSDVIRFPDTRQAMERCAATMELRSGLRDIIGALDGSHIRIHPYQGINSAYFNHKQFYSIILSAVVDARGLFMCVDTGFPGKMHDASVLRRSSLFRNHRRWFSNDGFSLYADAAYPLCSWLMTGFRNANQTPEQRDFNKCGSRARVIVEMAFGKLKGQWRVLSTGINSRTLESWNTTILACCILHNLTIIVGGQGWRFNDAFNGGRVPRDADSNSFPRDPDNFRESGIRRGRQTETQAGKAKRDRLLIRLRASGII